jgi:hypothetical protein
VNVAVFAPEGCDLPVLAEGVEIVRYSGAAGLAGRLRGYDAAVLVSDGLADPDAVAGEIRALGLPVIEVQAARWDGETHSALTAACRGVIAGFGAAAVRYALEALDQAT